MEHDSSVFVYKTIRNKQPKKIGKGVKLKQMHENLEQEFLKKGMSAFSDFKTINAHFNTDQAKQEIAKEDVADKEEQHKQLPEKPGEKVPSIKDLRGDNFIDTQESIEYLRKVKFMSIKKKRNEGKTDMQIQEEIQDDKYLDDEEKVLKSILKKSMNTSEDFQGHRDNQNRIAKISDPIQDKRKADNSQFISSSFAMRSGMEIPETQDVIQRRIDKEQQEAKDSHWKALMNSVHDAGDIIVDDGGYIDYKQLQTYSRETIVFYKRVSNFMTRWIISAGKIFDKQGYYFIPIKVIGCPLHKRSTIVYSTIYLELTKFPKSSITGKMFETIWPFLLYLLSNWVKHQLSVIGVASAKEIEEHISKRKEQKRKEALEGDTEEEKRKKERNEALMKRNQLKQMASSGTANFDNLSIEQKERQLYEEILNFSSEIEYDDEYDIFEDSSNQKATSKSINKSSDKTTVLEKKEVYPDPHFKESNTEKLFQQFLAEHTVRIPDSHKNSYKLKSILGMKKALAVDSASDKSGVMRGKGIDTNSIVLLNQERRKFKNLPPLTSLDYNCIDKAAIKLRTILDTLAIVRKVNGKALVKRHIREHALMEQRNIYHKKTLETLCQRGAAFTPELLIAWKAAVVYPDQFNKDQMLIK